MVLPFVLTGLIVLFDRVVRRVSGATLPSGLVPREILKLAALAVLTHPMLDTLNTYGMRWLMPLRGDWLYGDTLFIVDPWLWLVLGWGVLAGSGRRGSRGFREPSRRPARLALATGAAYVAVMLASGQAARAVARSELVARTGAPVERLMAGPRPLTPLVRQIVAVQGASYLVGEFRWLARPHVGPLRTFPRAAPGDPMLASARATPLGRRFLAWARFPTIEVERGNAGVLIHLIDLRYATAPATGFGSVTVAVTPPPASGPPADSPAASPPAGPAAPAR